MSENRTLQLFRALSKKELKLFDKFVRSPIYNQHQDVIALFEYLKENDSLNSEELFKSLFPKEKFEIQKIHHLNSYLLKVLEQFFAWIEWQEEENEGQIHLLRAYRKRQLPKHFDRVFSKLEKKQDRTVSRNRTFHFTEYRRFIERVKADSGKRLANTPLQKLSDAQDLSFIIEKLYNACTMVSHQAVVKKEYDTGLLEPLLQYLEKSEWMKEPAVSIYYYSYKALSANDDIASFNELKSLLQNYVGSFLPSELRDHYLIAINFCSRQINKGNKEFLREAFDFYKLGLKAEVFFENGQLSRLTYKNIVVVGLQLKEYEWVHDFIIEYAERLPEKIREGNKNHNLAHYYFEIKDYDQAMQLLVRTEFDNVLHNMFGKMLLAKMYFELKEQSALDNLLLSFKVYIHRHKELGYHKTHYLNFIKYTKRLTTVNFYDKAALGKLMERIKNEQYLVERKWLSEQVELLGRS